MLNLKKVWEVQPVDCLRVEIKTNSIQVQKIQKVLIILMRAQADMMKTLKASVNPKINSIIFLNNKKS